MSRLIPLLALLAAATFVQAAQAAPPTLFGPTMALSATAQKSLQSEPSWVAATRLTRPNLALLDELAAHVNDREDRPRFTLDLLDGVSVEAEAVTVERAMNGALSIHARLIGDAMGTAVLTRFEDSLAGIVSMQAGNYEIRPAGPGMAKVMDVRQDAMPPELEPLVVPGAAPTASDVADQLALDLGFDVPGDSGKLIDVAVVWTAAAQTKQGGLAAMQALVANAVADANGAYANSGIAQRLRLVSSAAVGYIETTSCGSDAFSCALNTLSAGSILSDAARTAVGADEVVLLIDDAAFCGLAWLPSTISSGNSGQGFAVVNYSCAVGNHSFAHELGHNMGANHDTANSSPGGPFAYNHGSTGPGNAGWRTIMSYPGACPGGCTRVQYFSNPNNKYINGDTMGDATVRNNALVLNKSANAVSNYKARVQPIVSQYTDVPLNDQFFGYIEAMRQAGYMSGCTGSTFCPNDAVTRRSMAVLLEVTKHSALLNPPAAAGLFTDVPVNSQSANFIEALYSEGITSGCVASPLQYCPDLVVTRAAMAKFILRAKCGNAYTPATPPSSQFADVANNDPFLPFINKLYTLGITSGCAVGPLQFCPTAAVTRSAMAKFLYNAFPFGTPSDVCTP